jgi:putative heme-binding domain-containing protein
MDERRRYFSWFNRERNGLTHPPELLQWFADVDRDYTDGASFPKFLANFKKEAEATLTKAERTALAGILEGKEKVPVRVAMAPRAFVKEWTMADLEPHLAKADLGRSFARGKEMFTVAQCAACHKFGNDGGATGQELTAVASRYTRPDILDSILHPSKVVSEQYQNTAYYLKDGEDVTGRVVDEEDGMLVIEVDPIAQTRVKVKATDVERKEASTISPMPEGLVNSMSLEEILDLLAYLESGGRQDRAAFKP